MIAIAVIALLIQPYPLLHDYPEWMYQGHIVHALLSDSQPALSELFSLVPVPVPNAMSQLIIGALNTAVSPVVAGQICLALYFVLVTVTSLYGFRSGSVGAMRLLFTVAIAFGPGFWNGYLNFQFGLMFFALFVISVGKRSLLSIVVFSLLIYFSHASVFAGFVCYVLLTEWFGSRQVRALAGLVPGLLLLLWYTVVRFMEPGGLNVGVGSLAQWIQYKLYTLAKQGPFHNFILPDGESLLASVHGLYMAGFVVNFLVAGIIGIWILVVLIKFIRRDLQLSLPEPVIKGLIGTVVALLTAWLLAGKNSFGVVNLGERFLIAALMLLILHCHCPVWLRRPWVLLCSVAGVVTIVSFLLMSRYADRQYGVCLLYTSPSPRDQRGSRMPSSA